MQEQAWSAAIEEEKVEKTSQVNKLIEKVKNMELKQMEVKQEMEQKLRTKLKKKTREMFSRCRKKIRENLNKSFSSIFRLRLLVLVRTHAKYEEN